MATTDALSVACKQLGIGADVYWDKDQNGKNYASAPASYAQQHPLKQRTTRVSPPALEERYVNSLWEGVKTNRNRGKFTAAKLQEVQHSGIKPLRNIKTP